MNNFKFIGAAYSPPGGDHADFAFTSNRNEAAVTQLALISLAAGKVAYAQSTDIQFDLQLTVVHSAPLQLIFDEAWPNLTSPITLTFGVVEPPPTPTPPPVKQLIGINVGVCWQANALIEQMIAINEQAADIDTRAEIAWHTDTAELRDNVAWHAEPMIRGDWAQGWAYKKAVMQRSALRWSMPTSHRRDTVSGWHTGPSRQRRTAINWRNRKAQQCSPLQLFTTGTPQQINHHAIWHGPAARSGQHVKWGFPEPRWVCTDKWLDQVPKSPLTLRFDEAFATQQSPLQLRFDPVPMVCHWDNGGGAVVSNPPLPPIDFKIPIQPQIRRMYLMQPMLTCHRVSDDLPIAISAVSTGETRSQFTRSVSVTFCSKGDAERAENALLRIGINGYDFYSYAEQPSKREAWANNSYQSSGRGRTAELTSPYQRTTTYSNNVARSFGGIASDLLQNSGWTIDASAITDFSVPAGVCTLSDKTPLDALNEIAGMIGCMLAADDETKTISLVPRWPTVPWEMASATPDVVISDSVILDHSVSTSVNPLCNACWLRGEQQGISAKITRNGTAGELATDDISNALIVDPQAARMAGTAALADTGTKQTISLTLPVMADLPPLKKGQLVGVTWRTETYRAICDGATVNATMGKDGRLTVRQQVTLIRSME